MQNTNERVLMTCPLNGALCEKGVRADFPDSPTKQKIECRWWVHLYGKDPQGENVIDQWDCAMHWMPILITENAQNAKQTTASVDKVSNMTHAMGLGLKAVAIEFHNLNENIKNLPEPKPEKPHIDMDGNGNGKVE